MSRRKLIWREIKNWFYLKKMIRLESSKKDSKWKEFNLRSNWFGRIYTIISLREEDMGEQEEVRNWKAMEKMRPINEYLSGLDLQEVIFPSIEKIPNSRSYLVVYTPLFKELTISWIFWRFMFLVLTTSITYIVVSRVL